MLLEILDTYGIPYEIKGFPDHPQVILHPPKMVTPWKPVAAIAGLVAFIIFLSRRGKG